ncbi:MAG: hypothetical protein IJA82_02705 [Clostridia bacterium]|nr:hypothetical protein [Clostridia bacterium]
MLRLKDLVEKRKKRWEELHSIEHDTALVNAIADKILDSKELREEIREKPWLLIECCFSLVDKKKRNVPFFFNKVQRDFIEKLEQYGRKKPFFVLKGRQQGFTTIITAIQLAFAIVRRNFSGFTLADRDDNTKTIFIDKAKVMYNALPERLKPHEKLNSVNELFFDKLNSSWRVTSASANVGRSRTLSFIHYSEIAFFRCDLSDLQKSIQEAAIEDALCIYETTANGFNEAKELWDSESCVNLFYEWWQSEEYSCTEYEYLDVADEWLSKRLAVLEKKGLSREQLAWYAKKYKSYIDKTAIRQEYPCTPEEAFVSSGDCIFDKDAISNYLSTFDVKSKLGYFEYKEVVKEIKNETGILGYTTEIKDISFKEDKNGYISIVEGPYVEKKGGTKMVKPYVIGADTAGAGLDYFTAKVLDNTTGRCVATLHKQRIDEDLFAKQIYCLGKYYNDALVAVETNYSRHPVRVLRELGYSNLYVAKKIGTAMDTPENYYGFVTSSITRPIIISNLVSVMREDITLETDRQTLKEMTTFIKRADGRRAAAADGTHDDLVMASAIAHFIGIDYEHQIKTIDEGFDVLAQFYNDTDTGNSYVEW